MPWGSQEAHIEWFMDIRNKKHPYYEEYKKMWADPIFGHPKVHDWSGGMDSENSKDFPYIIEVLKKKILVGIIEKEKVFFAELGIDKNTKFVVYGVGEIGKAIVKNAIYQGILPLYIIDKYSKLDNYERIEVHDLCSAHNLDKNVRVLVTALQDKEKIEMDLQMSGFTDIVFLIDYYG